MNLVIGDYIEFTLPQFQGGSFASQGRYRSSRGATYVGDQVFRGTIERDWYDTNRRHWFSIRLPNGKLKRVQGKNLYPGVTTHRRGGDHDVAAAGKAAGKQFREEVQA